MSKAAPDRTTRQLAAIDLGSNSFHLAIGRARGREVRLLDRVREPVRLASGLGKRGGLKKAARTRALEALERLGQRVRDIPPEYVRAVGTSTLRHATNAPEFLAEAEAALGHPIEIISGGEEGRLIYLGVAHSVRDAEGARLVVDIGGGSTECILGEHFEASRISSLDIGCVQITDHYFRDGRISRNAFEAARLHSQREFRTIERSFRASGWNMAVGASGTIRSAERVLRENGWGPDGITAEGLAQLRRALLKAGRADASTLKGLKADRAPVFAGGIAILQALFDRFEIERMTAVSGALREGVLYDLLGRIRHEDVRERTLRGFQERHGVDLAQADRVERLALALLTHAPRSWNLHPARDGRLLSWAARLHEIGLAVTWSRFHLHGAYLLRHADMPGFSRDDQHALATLVGSSRREIDMGQFRAMDEDTYERIAGLITLLRLAVLLNRARSPEPMPPLRLKGDPVRVRLHVSKRWLAKQPLSRLDLEEERLYLAPLGLDFGIAP